MNTLSKSFPYIEIVNNNITRDIYKHVLFDFDGTLSLIREGWQNTMQDYFEEVLFVLPGVEKLCREQVKYLIREFIEKNTGRQTIYQCIELTNYIEFFGGRPLLAQDYKKEYQKRLFKKIRNRLSELSINPQKKEKYLVTGSINLLEMLCSHDVQLYLASGTDQEYVEEEVKLLGLDYYFGKNIFGAREDYETFSKKNVINSILAENSIRGTNLLGIGDGYVEIENIKHVGGLACAVCSDESGSGDIDYWKYKRLKAAGADMLISDYRKTEVLENIWFE